jgi:hypothetical protein
MNYKMKTLNFLLVSFVIISFNASCNAQTGNEDNPAKISKTDKVEVFYFHYTRRCVTCQAVEKESKKAVEELYGGKVIFTGYNLEEPSGEKKGKDLGVSGQSLLIVKGDTKINITSEGFMNARSNPIKLKEIIKEKIDPLL